MPVQIQIVTAFLVLRDRMAEAVRTVRDDRGELTGSAIRSLDPFWSRVAVCQIESREASTTNYWFSPGSPSVSEDLGGSRGTTSSHSPVNARSLPSTQTDRAGASAASTSTTTSALREGFAGPGTRRCC